MKRILFVDDEPNVLQGLRRMLRPMRHEWEMTFVDSGQAALREIISHHYSVVVSDMRMPGMDGACLLEQVRQINPGTARIILSGQTDMEAALRSSSIVHQFLAKPCDEKLLRDAINKACKVRELLRDTAIQEVIGAIDSLPSLPQLYQELDEAIRQVDDQEGGIEKVSRIVSNDIAMSVKVLQLANSAFFGLSRIVNSVHHAVMLLGIDVIRALVLIDTVGRTFKTDPSIASYEWLWQHSFSIGTAAASLMKAESNDRHQLALAWQAGILHDVGKLILACRFPDKFHLACNFARHQKKAMHEAEEAIFGCHHGQVGAYLLGLWGLPDGIVEAVAYHHRPDMRSGEAEAFTPLMAVHIAELCVDYVEHESVSAGKSELTRTLRDFAEQPGFEHWMRITYSTAREVLAT